MEIKALNIDQIKQIRHEVLWPHLSSSDDCVLGPDNFKATFHIGAIENHQVIGTATFIIELNKEFDTKSQFRLRAMATLPEVRGRNVGRGIVEFALEKLKAMQVDLLWCDARLKATGFYEKMGFNSVGDIYEVPKIGPHKLMYYTLNE
ncbi:hypothetical protein DNU06_06200 [Putridiphycobacter roseus]|uniref:N-acetyltransferase domain-containing protein n=1 Tax=Putridiphycobacter roseus TaxID=2219161 RepID=A0A2W1NGH4_9FLAO|nr:GNAT family N-acetyltransferase [Putridiphycobacter roseus]PZE18203.1 hypothetical protein DNU06_06200 [Putridiphycobacter roseus]